MEDLDVGVHTLFRGLKPDSPSIVEQSKVLFTQSFSNMREITPAFREL